MRLAILLFVFCTLAQAQDHPPSKEPASDAPALTGFAAKTASGLRYVWWLPKNYDPKKPRHLSIICHGTGGDCRWGFWNNKPGVFRPEDIVVSLDGPSPGQGESRLFLGEPKDADAVRDVLAELRKKFAVDRVFLYGHSQGGFFVVYYAGQHPSTVAGVVAHASGAWNWSQTGPDVKKVAFAFLHGTADPVVPYLQSPGSRDVYADLKFPMLHLRRLELYNHWPNALRANECLSWAQGMTATDPKEALACAREILRPKGFDEYQWETVVGFAAARDILRRFEPNGVQPLKSGESSTAKTLIASIEAHAAEHVAALKALVSKKADLKIDDRTYLGHLLALREDFRGVKVVEEYFKSLGFDEVLDKQAKSVNDLFQAFGKEKDPAAACRAVTAALPLCFLVEGLPEELPKRLDEWQKANFKLSKEEQKNLDRALLYKKSLEKGRKTYAALWKKWKPSD